MWKSELALYLIAFVCLLVGLFGILGWLWAH
jgi:hypothetical protein